MTKLLVTDLEAYLIILSSPIEKKTDSLKLAKNDSF